MTPVTDSDAEPAKPVRVPRCQQLAWAAVRQDAQRM
jgi:hypothetical protein